jgi:hypothetical protein
MRTNWTEVGKFYGLLPPFNFRVAIPFLLNACLLGAVVLICAFLSLRGALHFGTARFYFFLYLALLLVIAAIFSRFSKLSYAIPAWCTIELSLALLPSLLPHDGITNSDRIGASFIYHPLLQSIPKPNAHYTIPLDFRGDDEAKAAGIDVESLQGQKLYFVHNSLGFRGRELTAADLAKDLIFAYGGSTTYDNGVTQGETWVDRLQGDLDNKYTILNLGASGFTTVENLIQTAFYQDIVGKKPLCAIYYVGNDIVNSHIEHLDGGYADYHLLLMAEKAPPLSVARYSPLLHLINDLAVRRFDSLPPPPQLVGRPPVAGPDEHMEAIFIEHIKAIAALNQARDVKTIFIGLILNRSWPGNHPDDWMPLVKEGDEVPLAERLKSILKKAVASTGAKYIDPGIANFDGRDFVDDAHFSARGSRKFAALVSKQVGDYCK